MPGGPAGRAPDQRRSTSTRYEPYSRSRAESPPSSRRPPLAITAGPRSGAREAGKGKGKGKGKPRLGSGKLVVSPAVGGTTLKVAADSLPQKIAGAITIRLRNGEASVLDAVGPQPIFTMAKALCIARNYLQDDGLDFVARVSFPRPEGLDPHSFVRCELEASAQDEYRFSSDMTMKVASDTNPKSTAAALAANAREGKSPSITALGCNAVTAAIQSIGIAREWLVDDRVEVPFKAFWVDPESNVMEFALLTETY